MGRADSQLGVHSCGGPLARAQRLRRGRHGDDLHRLPGARERIRVGPGDRAGPQSRHGPDRQARRIRGPRRRDLRDTLRGARRARRGLLRRASRSLDRRHLEPGVPPDGDPARPASPAASRSRLPPPRLGRWGRGGRDDRVDARVRRPWPAVLGPGPRLARGARHQYDRRLRLQAAPRRLAEPVRHHRTDGDLRLACGRGERRLVRVR